MWNSGQEMSSNFADKWWVSHHLKGSFTFRNSATWGRWLYYLLRIFSPWKIRRLRPGSNPRTWVTEASMLTPSRPSPFGPVSTGAEISPPPPPTGIRFPDRLARSQSLYCFSSVYCTVHVLVLYMLLYCTLSSYCICPSFVLSLLVSHVTLP
jgi:hypothetical protein